MTSPDIHSGDVRPSTDEAQTYIQGTYVRPQTKPDIHSGTYVRPQTKPDIRSGDVRPSTDEAGHKLQGSIVRPLRREAPRTVSVHKFGYGFGRTVRKIL